ncbi:MAG: DUF89 family protein [Candidatus Thermoplasmatota archaeon]|nr:DUF89 family protein [Candidatus Thermoplasmatota archaeon]
MKIQTQCVPCLIKRIIFEAEQSTKNEKLKTTVIKKACNALSKLYDPSECSADIATKVHKMVYETLDDNDPYRDLKKQSNQIALSLVPRVKELIEKSSDPLWTSMLCAIVGNSMDFGIEGASSHPDMLKETFQNLIDDGIKYDDSKSLKELIRKAKKILLFTDNCGEIVFDKIFCEELKKFNPDMKLTLVVKGKTVLSDATREDTNKLNFDNVVDEILDTGCFAVGVNFLKIPKNLREKLSSADLIICKGMANYESFSETDYRPIAYLLRTKCDAISSSMKVPINVNVIKQYS